MADRQTMNVSLSSEHKAFVRRQVASGRFRNDSEVIREGLRLLEDQDRHRQLEQKLLEALDGGQPIPADDGYWRQLRDRIARSNEPKRDQG